MTDAISDAVKHEMKVVTLVGNLIFHTLFFFFYRIHLFFRKVIMEFGILKWEWTDLNIYL